MRSTIKFCLLITIISTLSACTTTKTVEPALKEYLSYQEIEWTLQKIIINGKSYQPLQDKPKPTIYFKENKVVNGRMTVNSFFGKVDLLGPGKIEFGLGFGKTMEEVTESVKAQEDAFIDTLKEMKRSYVQSGFLYLSSENKKSIMIFSHPNLKKHRY